MQSQSVMEVGRTALVSGLGSSRRADVASTSQFASSASSDRVEFSSKGTYVSNLVQQVQQLPETRANVIQSYKAEVAAGNYPPPSIVIGFTKLIGISLSQENSSDSNE